jgi:hypothetical protein
MDIENPPESKEVRMTKSEEAKEPLVDHVLSTVNARKEEKVVISPAAGREARNPVPKKPGSDPYLEPIS